MSSSKPTIAIASDHAGFSHKQALIEKLTNDGYTVKDFGTNSTESCDYPDYIQPAAKAVASGEYDKGIVLGGSGNGEAIAANKIAGIRCALCWNEATGELATQHNNANMISFGERQTPIELAFKITDAWLNASFEGGRHQGRIDKLETNL